MLCLHLEIIVILYIYFSKIFSMLYVSEIDVERLRKMLTLSEVDLQDNPLSKETEEKLKDIDVFSVLVGESDPIGKQLDNVE